MKKLLVHTFTAIFILTALLSGCGQQSCAGNFDASGYGVSSESEPPLPSSEAASDNGKSESDQMPESEAGMSADIRYPQFVTDEFTDSPFYQEAARDGHAVILVDGTVITSANAAMNFFKQYQAGESCELNIYHFPAQWNPWENRICYDSATGELYELHRSVVETADGLHWGEESRYAVDHISLTEFGCICITGEASSEPFYTQVVSDYDLFEDYDRMVELARQYVSPIYLCVVQSDTFSNPSEITQWPAILERIVSMECADGESFWTVYPDGELSVDEMIRQISKYFEVDRDAVLHKVKNFMVDGDTIRYEGGLGGAYPQALVFDVQKSGDTTAVLCRLRDAITGDVDMDRGYLITVRNKPDGTFRYLSMKEVV
ncbi:hypothetical protein AALA99_14005 [Anaerotruncus colihominis]|uniref:hypothetical protein n=1 Tax=Anaerotruncus colihominis TaxID=169435 RepID=UPI003512656F